MLTLAIVALLLTQEAQDSVARYLHAHRMADVALVAGRAEEARAGFERCLELAPTNATAAYGLACSAARAKDESTALTWLEQAVEWGYADADVAVWDEDLALLRKSARFDAAVKRMREAGKGRDSRELALKIWDSKAKWPLSEVAVNRAGTVAALGDWAGKVLLLDARSGHLLRQLPSLGSEVWDLEFDPRDEHLVTLTYDGQLHFIDVVGGAPAKVVRALQPSSEKQMGWSYGSLLQFDPTGELLLAAGEDRGASVWTAQGEPVWKTQEAFGYFFKVDMAWSPDGKQIATMKGNEVRFLDARTGTAAGPALECPERVHSVAFQPGGHLLVTGHEGRKVRVWDLRTRKQLYEDTMKDDFGDAMGNVCSVNSLQFSLDGKLLAYSMVDAGFLVVIEAQSGKRVWASEHYGGRMGEPWEICWSPDNRRLWYSMASGVMHVFQVDLNPPAAVDVLARAGCPQGSAGGIAALEFSFGAAGVDMRSGNVLWVRSILGRAGEILSAPSGHFGGDVDDLDGLEAVMGVEGEGGQALSEFAVEYFDPKRVRAASAGVRVLAPKS